MPQSRGGETESRELKLNRGGVGWTWTADDRVGRSY